MTAPDEAVAARTLPPSGIKRRTKQQDCCRQDRRRCSKIEIFVNRFLQRRVMVTLQQERRSTLLSAPTQIRLPPSTAMQQNVHSLDLS
jgi:hypothetical protein